MLRLTRAVVWLISAAATGFFLLGMVSEDKDIVLGLALPLAIAVITGGLSVLLGWYDYMNKEGEDECGAN